MSNKLDFSREDAMKILNSESYTEEQKKSLYDQYMSGIKKNRKEETINRLKKYAEDIPTINAEIYVAKIKEYENKINELSIPFEVIEEELNAFANEMKLKYDQYLESQKQVVEEPVVTPEVEEDNFDDTIFNEPAIEFDDIDEEEEVKPSLLITDEISVINEDPEEKVKPLFEETSKESKELILTDDDMREKGNASAIIISIIAIIIGIAVMYSIIRFN